jgi:hypothetical protein
MSTIMVLTRMITTDDDEDTVFVLIVPTVHCNH